MGQKARVGRTTPPLLRARLLIPCGVISCSISIQRISCCSCLHAPPRDKREMLGTVCDYKKECTRRNRLVGGQAFWDFVNFMEPLGIHGSTRKRLVCTARIHYNVPGNKGNEEIFNEFRRMIGINVMNVSELSPPSSILRSSCWLIFSFVCKRNLFQWYTIRIV